MLNYQRVPSSRCIATTVVAICKHKGCRNTGSNGFHQHLVVGIPWNHPDGSVFTGENRVHHRFSHFSSFPMKIMGLSGGKFFPETNPLIFMGSWLHPDDSNSRPANRSRTWSNLWRRRRKESGRPGVRWYVSWGSPLSGLAIWEKHGKPMASWMMTWALSAIGWAIWAIWAIAGGKLLMLKGPNSCCGILSNRNLYAICLLNCVPICTKKPNLVGIIPATVNVTKSELWICCVQTENPGYEADDHGREVWRFPWWDSLVRSWTCAQYNYPLVMSK